MEYGKFIGGYVGTITVMAEMLVIIFSIFVLTFLNANKDKINRILFYLFHAILYLVLLFSLYYFISGTMIGILYINS